jgi:hypothetical protein
MSSVLGLIDRDSIPFSYIENCLGEMSSEFPSVHVGEFGTKVGLLFSTSNTDQDAHFLKQEYSTDTNTSVGLRRLGNTDFVYILTQYPKDEELYNIFDRLGLRSFSTDLLLAEQTAAHIPNEMVELPSLCVFEQTAFAACGDISWVIDNSSVGQSLIESATRMGIKEGYAQQVGAWIEKQRLRGLPYSQILEQVPTILASVVLEIQENSLALVGLRRNVREDGFVYQRDYLYYAPNNEGIIFASTEKGLRKINANNEISIVRDMEPMAFQFFNF